MTSDEYSKAVLSTEALDRHKVLARVGLNIRLLHGLTGIITEAGKLMDGYKRAIIYGKALDVHNVLEELGDLMWYLVITADSVGYTLSEVFEANVDKLKKRYPEGHFSEAAALARADKAE